MKPASFRYFRAHSVAEAVSLLHEHGEEAKLLAGGQSLVPAMNFRLARPGVLVDVNPIKDLDYVRAEGSTLLIGALVRHIALENNPGASPVERLMRHAAGFVGHLPIRVRGSFGGSLAHADPAAEWCVLGALFDAEFVAESSTGRRTIPASDFFQTIFTTDLDSSEVLIEARFPLLPDSWKVGMSEFSRRAGDFALTIATVALEVDGSTIKAARIALGGVSDKPVRPRRAEQELVGGEFTNDLFEGAAEVAAEEFEPLGDIHGSAEYRRDLVRALTKRALQQAASG